MMGESGQFLFSIPDKRAKGEKFSLWRVNVCFMSFDTAKSFRDKIFSFLSFFFLVNNNLRFEPPDKSSIRNISFSFHPKKQCLYHKRQSRFAKFTVKTALLFVPARINLCCSSCRCGFYPVQRGDEYIKK